MSIEEGIFKKSVIDFNKLAVYGFIKSGNLWQYTTNFMNNDFRAEITIDESGVVSGKVYETDNNEEYIPLRVEAMSIGYSGQVRSAYEQILSDIKEKCAHENYFILAQSNRLAKAIYNRYGDKPSFPWDKFTGYGVFVNPQNHKWYAVIMNIDKSKVDKKQSGETEIVNLKLDGQKIVELLGKKGFYPAYHMNKKNWISVALDESVTDDMLLVLLEESHLFTEGKSSGRGKGNCAWLVPANPQYFDIKAAFAKQDEIIWKQSANIKVGDTAYMYIASPVSAVCYKCKVTEADIPYDYQDKNLKISKVMKIKRLKTYSSDFMPLSRLKDFGVSSIRSQRLCPDKLKDALG